MFSTRHVDGIFNGKGGATISKLEGDGDSRPSRESCRESNSAHAESLRKEFVQGMVIYVASANFSV